MHLWFNGRLNYTRGLSCPKAKGTFPRHVDLNRIVHRALTSARHISTLEPIGLSRDDVKRPDGITLAPWSKGKRACKLKHDHYTQIKASNFLFVGLAFETFGPWCTEAKSFVDIGR